MSVRVTVVKPEEYWSRAALAWASGLMGFLLTIGFLFVWIVVFTVVSVAGAEWLAEALIVPLLLTSHVVVPAWKWWRRGIQIVEWKRGLLAGLSFGFGISLFPWLLFTIGAIGGLFPPAFAGIAIGVFFIGMPPYAIAFCGLGMILRERFGVAVIQDGTMCPGCGYSLIGNTTMICPECGRAFTFEELETTEAEFRGKHKEEGRVLGA